MDSRSGPELPNKVHVFDETVKLRDPFRRVGMLFLCLFISSAVACGPGSDPRTIDGALGKVAFAVARRDHESLFRVIDQRARHALSSIVKSRHEAARVIERSYPAEQRAEALAKLGDARTAKDAADLFRVRCPEACLRDLADRVGAVVSIEAKGDEQLVKTTRGTELRMFRGKDGWYGVVWNTQALVRERERAAAETDLVRANAQTFTRRGALDD
jgi:hypothetical protein